MVGYYLIVLLGRRGVLGAPLYQLTGWTVAFTWYAAVIAATVMALPLLVRTVRAAIESVDRDLERAAYTLGRSELRTALEVTLPLARNGILAGLVLAFARALGEFGATLMLAGNIPGAPPPCRSPSTPRCRPARAPRPSAWWRCSPRSPASC